MAKDVLRIIAFGAHPDDCDFKIGGLAVLYARLGHAVKFVSFTNGDAGHFASGAAPLARRREREARAAARTAGIEYEVFDVRDGQLLPSLENRMLAIRAIREFRPDLVITHRPNDYHPDHRYCAQIIQDAAYMVTVPNVLPLTPHLVKNPVFAYMSDDFRKPSPFTPHVAISVDESIDAKMRMLHCHESQMYEWLPYTMHLTGVPASPRDRLKWLTKQFAPINEKLAARFRPLLKRLYGAKRGARVRHAEALEISEYGSPVGKADFRRLFPFFR